MFPVTFRGPEYGLLMVLWFYFNKGSFSARDNINRYEVWSFFAFICCVCHMGKVMRSFPRLQGMLKPFGLSNCPHQMGCFCRADYKPDDGLSEISDFSRTRLLIFIHAVQLSVLFKKCYTSVAPPGCTRWVMYSRTPQCLSKPCV